MRKSNPLVSVATDFILDPTSSADCFRRLLKTYLFAHYGPITIAIRARFEYDSTTIRLRFGYNTLRDAYASSTIQHPTRNYVLSSNNEHVNSFAML